MSFPLVLRRGSYGPFLRRYGPPQEPLPGVAPAVTQQPSIAPVGAVLGESITIRLGAASGFPEPSPSWALFLDDEDVSHLVDEYMAVELNSPGLWELRVSWSNDSGTAPANAVSLLVEDDAPSPGLDLASASYLHIEGPPVFSGTPELVTGFTAGGSGSRSFSIVGSGADVRMDAERGLRFGAGRFGRNTGNSVDSADGFIAIVRYAVDTPSATDTPFALSNGLTLNMRWDGANNRLQYNYNFGSGAANQNGLTGTPGVLAIEVDRVAGTLRYWDGEKVASLSGLSLPALSFGTIDIGNSLDGAVLRANLIVRPAGGAWPASLEEVLAAYGSGTPVAPSMSRLLAEPIITQSEGRAKNASGYHLLMRGSVSTQAVYVAGMQTMEGAAVPAWGAAEKPINQTILSSGFGDAASNLNVRVSTPYAMQYLRVQDALSTDEGAVALIGDNGYGGLAIEKYLFEDEEFYAENQLFWMEEAARLAAETGATVEAPFFFHWLGTSGKADPYHEWRDSCDAVWSWHVARMSAAFGGVAVPLLVQTGGDVNTVSDLYDVTAAQYDLVKDFGGHIIFPQRGMLINDGNIHNAASESLLFGGVGHWARSEIVAGNPWTMWASVSKAGSTVSVSFALRPDESLEEWASRYDAYGGPSTCPDFGFEADGGIASVVPNWSAGTFTITLNNPSASWLRFAMQRQDVSTMTDGRGWGYGAHRSTIISTLRKPSPHFPEVDMLREPPSFCVLLSGDSVSRMDGTPFT